MLVAIFMGFFTVVALVCIMARINLSKFMGYPVLTDLGGTILFSLLFAGTLTGMLVAVVAGLLLSAFTWVYRYLFGFKRYTRKTGWSYYPPRRLV